MPIKPGKPCSVLRCPHIVYDGSGYCNQHKYLKPIHHDLDKKADSFYTSSRWKRLRAWKLSRDPICEICQEVPATVVDHIIPIKQGGHETDIDNLQSLCVKCHAVKSGKERRRLKV